MVSSFPDLQPQVILLFCFLLVSIILYIFISNSFIHWWFPPLLPSKLYSLILNPTWLKKVEGGETKAGKVITSRYHYKLALSSLDLGHIKADSFSHGCFGGFF